MLRSNNVTHKYKSTRNDMLENFIAILEVAQLFSNKVYARHDAACGARSFNRYKALRSPEL